MWNSIIPIHSSLNVKYNPETDIVQILFNGVWHDWKRRNLQRYYLIADGAFQIAFDNPPSSTLTPHGCIGGWQMITDGLYAPAPDRAGGYQMCTSALFDFTPYTTLHVLYDNDLEQTLDVSNLSNAYVLVFNSRANGGEGSCVVYLSTSKSASTVISGKALTLATWASGYPKATTVKSIWLT